MREERTRDAVELLGGLVLRPVRAVGLHDVELRVRHPLHRRLRALQIVDRVVACPQQHGLVLDLLQHNFEEARELYADVWLGFGEGELAAMLEKAGFEEIETAVVDREGRISYTHSGELSLPEAEAAVTPLL